jgi:multiple antibiotic resistance protein
MVGPAVHALERIHAAIGSFLAITAGASPERRKRMAGKACLTCFIVLACFALAGQFIFKMFGITLPAFEIAGGLILMLIGIDMLEAKRSPTQESTNDAEEATHKEDAGIVPLGIPMLAGPGAISSVMVMVGQATSYWQMGAILGSIAITAGASYGVLSGAERLQRVLGETGIRILVRIMGLLLRERIDRVGGYSAPGVGPEHENGEPRTLDATANAALMKAQSSFSTALAGFQHLRARPKGLVSEESTATARCNLARREGNGEGGPETKQ